MTTVIHSYSAPTARRYAAPSGSTLAAESCDSNAILSQLATILDLRLQRAALSRSGLTTGSESRSPCVPGAPR